MSKNHTAVPLIQRDLSDIIAWQITAKGIRKISCADFLHDVKKVAAALPDKKYAVNLCKQRYAFMVSFAAAMCRGQTNLLPPNQATEEIQAIADEYDDSYFLLNDSIDGLQQEQFQVDLNSSSKKSVTDITIPDIAYQQLAAITFTSGSSGTPSAQKKQWGDIICCAKHALERFKLELIALDKTKKDTPGLVGTVPSQHMYGLETTILYPLAGNVAVFDGQPFYPEDIRKAIASFDSQVILVTTPVHLRACIQSACSWQNVKFVISAAAALQHELAKDVQQAMQAPVYEIYGCTEAGSMATRETVHENTWLLYDGLELYRQDDTDYARADYLPEDVALADNINIHPDGRFELTGRHSDVIKIAGKRGHMGDLNNKLLQVEGVQSGIYFMPDENNRSQRQGMQRLIAFAVAPGLQVADILSALTKKIDPVFLPRPLYLVDALPFNEAGKLPRKVLQQLYESMKLKANNKNQNHDK